LNIAPKTVMETSKVEIGLPESRAFRVILALKGWNPASTGSTPTHSGVAHRKPVAVGWDGNFHR